MIDAGKLHTAIAALAPIHGVSIGDPEDRATWGIAFTDEATEAERDAAQAALMAFDADAADPLPPLSPRQLLLAARSIGIYEADILAAIAAIEDAEAREIAQIEWAKAGTYERSHWLVEQLRETMDFSSAQFDALWQWGATL